MAHATLVAFLWATLPQAVLQCLGWSSTWDIDQEMLLPRVKHFVEFFCGTGGLTAALSQAGMRCAWFDIDVEDSHRCWHRFCCAAGIVSGARRRGLVWCSVQHICVDGARPHEALPAEPAGRCGPWGCEQSQPHRKDRHDPVSSAERSWGLLHHGAARRQCALAHAMYAARSQALACERPPVGPALCMVRPLRAPDLQAHRIVWRVPKFGRHLAIPAPAWQVCGWSV